ncbi:hypothetical protein EV702DRAFT_1199507 [Suillus placidus]|uniref:Uncharacterized protein n=1 Tax=Suillus placidus TaxID=48579 RepID=A0A9P7D0N7_9AGAM|nr:hypothetical protein EV702DRAFT_1199507 [Suillus placidus]
MSSSELQYIVEMSGQWLLPVPNTENGIPVSTRLQLLRDKAHAWFKVDIHSFETVLIKGVTQTRKNFVAGGHLYLWNAQEDTATIFPIFPKPSQQSIQRDWPPGALCSVPHSYNLDVFMDPAQNLIAVVYVADHETVYIRLGTLDGDDVHPQAAGERLFLSDNSYNSLETIRAKLKGFGRHIALWRRLDDDNWASLEEVWQLQIWDWQNSTTSNSILNGGVPYQSNTTIDFCFLGNNRLLVITDNLKLYSIEDMSQTPELLACFLMPVSLMLRCLLPTDDIGHSSQQVQQTMYTSDPTHRLLCLTASSPRTSFSSSQVFIISTRIFFHFDRMAAATPIPWKHWGPSNSRIFRHPYHFKIHISGNQVLQALPVGTRNSESMLHLMDFSPLAVTNRRGLGRVVEEPSTIDISDSTGRSGGSLTTSLPYVQVVLSDRKFNSADSELQDIWIDRDRIYMLTADVEREMFGGDPMNPLRPIDQIEVVDI